MRKLFLLIPTLFLAIGVSAAIPELSKSTPLTLTAASEGFSQSSNANALDGEWINWPGGTIQDGYAMWRVNIVNSGIYAVTLDMTCDNTSEFLVSVINPITGDTIDTGNSSHDWAKTDAALSCGSVSLINLEPGEYDIAVTEVVQWSHAKLRGATITYLNGERVTLPATLLPLDAVLSQYAQYYPSTGAGVVDSLTFAPKTSEWQAVDGEYSVEGSQYVKWNIKAKGGKYKFTANTYCKQGHNYRIMILNADETSILYTKQEKEGTGSDYHNEGADWQVATDVIDLPKGNYVLKMQGKAYGRVMSVEAEYMGGAIVNLPATLMPEDAIRSQYAQLDKSGAVDSLTFAPKTAEWYAIDANYTVAGSQYVKWIMNVEKAGKYKFTANTYCKQGHNYRIILMNEAETDTIVKIQEAAGTGSDYHNEKADWQYGTDAIDLTAGKYVLMMQGKSYGRVMSVEAEYVGGAIINIPDTLWPADAMRSERAFVNEDGEFRFTDDDHTGNVTSQWGKWNIHVGKTGLYSFTFNANSTNSHHYQLHVLTTSEVLVTDEPYTLDGSSNQELLTTTPKLQLAEGDYIIKVTNTTNYSKGRVIKIIANYEGGAVTALPGQIVGDDALLTGNIIRLENRDLKSSNTSSPTAEYAEWNVSFVAAGTMTVQLNLDPVTSSGHNYRVELYNGNNLVGYAEELASTDPAEAKYTKGDIDLEQMIAVPAAGNYTVKLVNRTQWSSMILQGITFAEYIAPAAITMTDTDTDNTAWVANVGGAACNVQLERTILGGMYNAICLPFALTGSQVKAAFGDDVELYYLDDASLEGEVLNLQFATANDIYQGTPYLIKTSSDVTNPTFNGVSIVLDEASSTFHTGWPVSFKGSFVAQSISGSDNLLLYANDRVGFSTSDATLKGFRAYFHLTSPSLAPAIKKARIVTPHGSTTAFELVETQNNGTIKTIENGQLIIIRDGVHYNVMGARVK